MRTGFGIVVATLVLAAPTLAHKYIAVTHWPTGVYEQQTLMFREDAPLCRAVAKALNSASSPKPLAMCRAAPLASGSVVEARWEPAHADDPFALYVRFEKALLPKVEFSEEDIADAKTRLADGRYRFETTVVHNLPPLSGDVRLLRLAMKECETPGLDDFTSLVVAGDPAFKTLSMFTGLNKPASAFAYYGRTYFLGTIQPWFDRSTAKQKAGRTIFDVAETFSVGDEREMASVCRIRYR